MFIFRQPFLKVFSGVFVNIGSVFLLAPLTVKDPLASIISVTFGIIYLGFAVVGETKIERL